MIEMEPVGLDDLTDYEKQLIVLYCAQTPDDVSIENVVRRVRAGHSIIGRLLGEGVSGIFILSCGDDGYFLETVSGEGIIKNFEEIYEIIRNVAMEAGVDTLYSYVNRPGLKRCYERWTNAKPVATLYREDLK